MPDERDADIPARGICDLLPYLTLFATSNLKDDSGARTFYNQRRTLEIRLPEESLAAGRPEMVYLKTIA